MKEIKKLKLEELNRLDEEGFEEVEKIPIILILDNIRSGLNVGSLFRTSDAFRISEVLLCGITAKPPHKEILKTAIGANRTVNWDYYENVQEACKECKRDDYILLGLEQTNQSKQLNSYRVDTSKKYAIVLGNEVEGISEETLKFCDSFIEIPQFGTKHSLNVAVCGGIVVHYFALPYLLKLEN